MRTRFVKMMLKLALVLLVAHCSTFAAEARKLDVKETPHLRYDSFGMFRSGPSTAPPKHLSPPTPNPLRSTQIQMGEKSKGTVPNAQSFGFYHSGPSDASPRYENPPPNSLRSSRHIQINAKSKGSAPNAVSFGSFHSGPSYGPPRYETPPPNLLGSSKIN